MRFTTRKRKVYEREMATIHMDLPSANSFVSSLSKSLQALCHGCMDFDTEIEIIGYINVNIDSGSRVDYVLNEKVSKSTNNMMEFISNSFLAKKDQPKRDVSCSPIPELFENVKDQPASSFCSSSQIHKSSRILSPDPQVPKSSQKRFSLQSSHQKNAQQTHGSSYEDHPPLQQYQNILTSPKPTTPNQNNSRSENSESHIHIKSETGSSYSKNIPIGEDISSQESSAFIHKDNMKSDPDSLETSNIFNSSSNEPLLNSQSVDNAFCAESNSGQSWSQNVQRSESFFKTEFSDSFDYQESGDYNCEPPNSCDATQNLSETDDVQEHYTDEVSGDGSQFDIIEIDDEDEAEVLTLTDGHPTTETALITSSHVDRGSFFNSSTSTDFNRPGVCDRNNVNKDGLATTEATLYTNSHVDYSHSLSSTDFIHPSASDRNESLVGRCAKNGISRTVNKLQYRFDKNSHQYFCLLCNKQYGHLSSVSLHIKQKHEGLFPYFCKICKKGLRNNVHIAGHMTSCHGQPMQFECSICGLKYAVKSNLRRHQKQVHGSSRLVKPF